MLYQGIFVMLGLHAQHNKAHVYYFYALSRSQKQQTLHFDVHNYFDLLNDYLFYDAYWCSEWET